MYYTEDDDEKTIVMSKSEIKNVVYASGHEEEKKSYDLILLSILFVVYVFATIYENY
jgi:hypothetical protein